ncbi:AraC family transcriptional regulator [Turicimonas muris]|uniref:AraC family transcriptional regulator n=2 Tax=Turicimonas muris TaxID=1796652 RepID=A0A227KAU6_9BURK|nr:AraC family transcriptional regulator [Turicimonas muris]ANU65780.1 AraC family transcriptional regulator [Burkholderiales bacterium YL45]OXE44511.1 AraC family transcriptional regulator [Turicimonas muris]QQQ96939.1 helix-turn-helix transcriptional regulator [Turicimonas muris]
MQVTQIPIDCNLQETTHHVTEGIPLAIYRTYLERNVLGYVGWHWHNELQYCLVTSGEIDFRVEDNYLRLKTGEGFFVNSRVLHMARPTIPQTSNSYICLNFSPKILVSSVGAELSQRLVHPFISASASKYFSIKTDNSSSNQLLKNIEAIEEIQKEKKIGNEIKLISLVLEIWHQTLPFLKTSSKNDRNDRAFAVSQQIITFLEVNITESISLKEISLAVNLSREECCRLFKEALGITISSYILKKRMDLAAQMLLSSNRTVEGVGRSCGFNSTSYFIKNFKNTFGQTPLSFLKQYRGR